MSNDGESGELILKARVLLAMKSYEEAGPLGKIHEANVGDLKSRSGCYRYPLRDLPIEVTEVCESPDMYSYDLIKRKLAGTGVAKAGSSIKPDISINSIFYSVKSADEKPAIINHTKRSGFLNAARLACCSINALDLNILRYWKLRLKGVVGEDVGPSARRLHNLFWDDEFKAQFRSIFNYFAFEGTGRGLSRIQAQMILEFDNPRDPNTWRVHSRQAFYNECWPKLVFSLRNKNPGPIKTEDKPWINNCNGKDRGQLHVRVG